MERDLTSDLGALTVKLYQNIATFFTILTP